MAKGRILVLFGNIPLYGQERENIEAIAALVEKGWDALFVTHPEWGHQQVQPELDARGLRWTTATFADRFDRGIGARGWLRRLGQIARGSWQLRRILRAYRPTHIHLGNPQWFIAFFPVLLLIRTPIVYRIGDTPAQHRWIFRTLWRNVLGRRVTRFVCISKFITARLMAAADAQDKTTVIISRPAARGFIRRTTLPVPAPFQFTFVYTGQVTKEKGVDLIVEVALRLCAERDDVRFLLAGDTSWNNPFAERLIRHVRANREDDRILFLGYVDDIDALLAVADVHLCPSVWQEPLGVVVLEAKQAARPSIVFPSGGLTEMVTDGVDGVVCADKSAAALEAACRIYLECPQLAREHGAAAKVSLEGLGVNEFAERWEEVYARAARS